MIKKTWFKSGSWNAICDICGEKHKAEKLLTRWDGLKTCSACWEVRHPQELIRPIKERNSVPWTRPRPEDDSVPVCTLSGLNGIAGFGVAGCMTPSYDNEIRILVYPPTFNANTL